jgi:hypothetical protein
MPSRCEPRHRRAAGALAMRALVGTALAVALGATARASDALVFSAREIQVGAARITDAVATLKLLAPHSASLEIKAAHAVTGTAAGTLGPIRFTCAAPVIADPRFGCPRGALRVGATPIGAVDLDVAGEVDVRRAVASASFGGRFAAGRLTLTGSSQRGAWSVEGNAQGMKLSALRTLLAAWVTVPADWTLEAGVTANFKARGASTVSHVDASAALASLNLSNDAGTIVAENVSASLAAALVPRGEDLALTARVRGESGQALAGPVLLDFEAHPLALDTSGIWRGESIALERIEVTQPKLLAAHGKATLALGEAPRVERAHLVIEALEFPAAYTSLMQITLATTPLGDLATAGRAAGEVRLAGNAIESATLTFDDLDFADRGGQLFVDDLAGTIHWAPATGGGVAPSSLRWNRGGAYGLSGGAAAIEFLARGAGFEFNRPARVPIFDGAVAIRKFAMQQIGTPDMRVLFAADIEPISMQPLTRAFGWPEFSGSIAGSIPGLEVRNNELRVDGDVEAQVFDGRIVASNLRLADPFGNFPRFFADVRGRNLDLALVTSTFSVGSITGRLDADVLGLELFGWQPIAFDARLETPRDDRSTHRISAKAVRELSNLGGGGGGVTAALQGGVLRFFDEYSYDRLGIRCKLENDVCLMAGIEPARTGYYIVKGRGIPRIDIIGNQGRVNWPQLVSQIASGMQSTPEVGDRPPGS